MESIFIQKQTDTYSVENGIAKREEAIAWLEGCQNENGSWGSECSLRDTCEVLKYAKDDWFSKKEVMGDAKEWGKSQKASSHDDIYRINSIKKTEQNSDITEVTALQNEDGGWSLNGNYASDVFDTLLALEACINADELHSDTIKKGVAYIMLNQMDNGAFSYAGGESNIYLTAYATYVMEDYIKGIGRNDESAKIALAKADEYLISREDASSLWGLDEKGMIATLMSSIVLADDDIQKTCERIEIIAGVVDADGSVYGSPVLTAMFVSLVDSVSEAKKTEVEITDLYIYTGEEQEIKAYTEVYIEPEVEGFDENAMSLSVVAGTRENGYETIAVNDAVYTWNTKARKAGKYEIYGIVTEDTTGDVLSIKKKVIEIKESFDIVNSYMNVTPIMYKIGSGKELNTNISMDIESNTKKDIEVVVNVVNEKGDVLYSASKTAESGEDRIFAEFNNYSFVPEIEESETLYVRAEIFVDNEKYATKDKTVSTYLESEGKRIDVSYDVDKEYVVAEEDEVNVSFSLEGVGLIDGEKRKPIDIFICLDNSWSMSNQDWKQAKLAAEQIVNYLGTDDKCTIQYIGDSYVKCELTSDKNLLIGSINSGGIDIFGGTKVDRSIILAIEKLKDTPASREKVYLLLSDGEPNNLTAAITSAENAVLENIKIYTLGLGNSGAEFMQKIADMGSGKYVYSPTNEELVNLMVDIAGDIFSVAGTEAELKMTLERDVDYENVSLTPALDEIIKNEDGTTTIVWSKPYISIGEVLEYDIKFNTNGKNEGDIVKLIKDIQFTYTDMSEEKVTIAIDPINIRVKNQYVSSNITTDKDSYITGENVEITLEATKEVNNKTLTGVVEITDENGGTVEVIDDSLTMDDKLTESYAWNTGEVVSGDYKAVISWYRNGKVVDREESVFVVQDEAGEEESSETDNGFNENPGDEEADTADFVQIKGSISVSDKDVLTGTHINAAYNAVNHGTEVLQGTTLKVNVINVETLEAKTLDGGIHQMDVKATVNGEAGIDTTLFAEGNYIVALNAVVGEEQLLLGATGFTVTEPKYSISVTSQAGGTVNTEMTGSYKENTVVELKATSDEGYIFAGWMSENGGVFENEYGETTTFITPGNDTVVTAMFVKKKYTVTVETGKGGKLIKEVTGSYEEGTELSLKAEAFSGYDFKCWSVSGAGAVKDENNATTTLTTGAGETVVTALFTEKGKKETGYNITIQADVGGKIVTGESKTYTSGTKIDITAVPDDGYRFDYWLVTGSGYVADRNAPTTTFTVIDGDAGVKAVFTRIENETESGKKKNETTDSDNSEKSNNSDRTTDKYSGNSSIDGVKTGDFGERAMIIRNMAIMIFIMVLVSMAVVRKEENE